MSQASGNRADPASHSASAARGLSTIVYSSRAVAPLSDSDLQNLMQTAQARNQREGVTGVVVYDDNRFFQWLEGPAAGVDRIMNSIRGDRRHTDIQVIARRASAARRFDGWDMKLAAPGADPAAWNEDILKPPADMLDTLRRKPETAPTLLVKLLPTPSSETSSPLAASLQGVALKTATARILKQVIQAEILPHLLQSHTGADAGPIPPIPRASELAELLVAPDHTASLALIRELRSEHGPISHLFAPLVEPAARSLGDMWESDAVSEFEVTLGLCRLQSAVRLLGADAPREALRGIQPKVMIAPVPGELHQLVAALDSEWLWSRGWTPQSEFPVNDQALTDLVSTTWVDILDLSLSAAFRRKETLPRLARTIALARRASLNPHIVVVVGGRAFVENKTIGLDVGADASSNTSQQVDRLITHTRASRS